MPTKLKNKNGQWQARVYVNGRQAVTKLFPTGRKGGPEWRAAKEWEEEQKAAIQAGIKTDLDLESFARWLKQYLEHAWRTMTTKTSKEKAAVLADFSDWCLDRGINDPTMISPQIAHEFLASIHDHRGANVANKYRKNLLAAWNWGGVFIDGFPDRFPPFLKVRPFVVIHQDRYVPPDNDLVAVLAQAKGQDAVMLLAYIQTGARRNELFGLSWKDVDLKNRRIKLTDKKGGSGIYRERWQSISDDLVEALEWWKGARPMKVDNVFMQLADYGTKNSKTGEVVRSNIGDPFQVRRHFMKNLCRRAGVKPFGFHALRHKAAEIVYLASESSNEAQILLGHSQASTTNRYLKSAGLYTDKGAIVNAIANSPIGRAATEMLKREMAPKRET